jgi:hypothetical protein
MKLTEQQFLILLDILKSSLRFGDRADGFSTFGYDKKTRGEIYNEIINQQDGQLTLSKEDKENKDDTDNS